MPRSGSTNRRSSLRKVWKKERQKVVKSVSVRADGRTVVGNETKIGLSPRTDIMDGERFSCVDIAVAHEIKDAESDAVVVACQGVLHPCGYPACISLGNKIFMVANGYAQCARHSLHKLHAIVAVRREVEALASRDFDDNRVL